MWTWLRRYGAWAVAWCVLAAAGGALLSQLELTRQREAFETDMRIVHRLLSQRVVQHEAVLATLALLQPPASGVGAAADRPEQRLPALYPQILSVQRREADGRWNDPALQAAETLSRALRRPVLAGVDFAHGRYQLVLAAEPASFALQMDLRAVVPWSDWPMAPQASPVRVTLEHASQTFVLQPGLPTAPGDASWRFEFHKHLAADSQPFDVAAVRQAGFGDLPWGWILAWAFLSAAFLAALAALQRLRQQRRRAEELLRLGQVGRLNTMGELAAGMAHELNQPLTAILANTQAAQRLLAEEPPELETARDAMGQAAQQARRAADVIGRLRRTVERPEAGAALERVSLPEAVRNALYLLEPELGRSEVVPVFGPAPGVWVLAEPVALEQIVHNLLVNALQALQRVPAVERRLAIDIAERDGQGVLAITDSGPGFTEAERARLFEPFFSRREGGLGLGLSLCESLAAGMGASVVAAHHLPRGARLVLALPLAADAQAP